MGCVVLIVLFCLWSIDWRLGLAATILGMLITAIVNASKEKPSRRSRTVVVPKHAVWSERTVTRHRSVTTVTEEHLDETVVVEDEDDRPFYDF